MASEFEARGNHVRLPMEVREADDGGIRVEGYAAVFDQEADIGGTCSAFTRRCAAATLTR